MLRAYYLLFAIVSSSTLWSQDTITVFLNTKTKLKTDLPYDVVAEMNPDILNFDIISGKFIHHGTSFTLGIFNANQNDRYDDVGVDKIVTGLYIDSALYVESGSEFIQPNGENYIKCNSQVWQIVEINSYAKTCTLVLVEKNIQPRIHFITKLPHFEMRPISGELVNTETILSSHKPSIVVFWADWCPLSVPILKEIDSIYRYFSDKINILGINGDPDIRNPVQLQALIQKRNLKYPQALNSVSVSNGFAQENKYPILYLFDKDGDLISTFFSFKEVASFLADK